MKKNIQTTEDTISDVRVNTNINTDTTEIRILEILRDDYRITIKNLAINLNLPEHQVERSVAKLKQEGKLRRVGASKSGHWEVID